MVCKMKYIYREIKKHEIDKSFLHHFILDLEYYKYVFFFSMFKIYNGLNDFFFKSKQEKDEEQDAEKVFEYSH